MRMTPAQQLVRKTQDKLDRARREAERQRARDERLLAKRAHEALDALLALPEDATGEALALAEARARAFGWWCDGDCWMRDVH
jgi:hypothetical protein